MVLHILRGLFVLIMAAVGWAFLGLGWGSFPVAVGIAVAFIAIDVLSPRRKLVVLSGVLFGLMVGTLIAYALSFAVELIVDQLVRVGDLVPSGEGRHWLVNFAKLIVAVISCYLAISFTLQSKDDFRFIIPYVEFKRSARGARPFLVDTSALIDGRVEDLARAGVLDAQLVVPRFVLAELQAVADSGDKAKRARGRRGLDVLTRLRAAARPEVVLYDADAGRPADARTEGKVPAGVDGRLIDLAVELEARVLTTDVALGRVAQLRGVDAINLNDLAAALRPTALPGERMRVRLVKPGESGQQGVGYLEDGTMVVVEQGRPHLNETVDFTVTSALQTSAGRMIFGRLAEGDGAADVVPPRRGADHGERAAAGAPAKAD
ncbi:MAG TPA: hypothetical protein VF796_05210 [Humisphaera sp.]